jgi:hypothetical protein
MNVHSSYRLRTSCVGRLLSRQPLDSDGHREGKDVEQRIKY